MLTILWPVQATAWKSESQAAPLETVVSARCEQTRFQLPPVWALLAPHALTAPLGAPAPLAPHALAAHLGALAPLGAPALLAPRALAAPLRALAHLAPRALAPLAPRVLALPAPVAPLRALPQALPPVRLLLPLLLVSLLILVEFDRLQE